MCRMVGYLGGPPVSLSSAVLEPEHSLHGDGERGGQRRRLRVVRAGDEEDGASLRPL
jgi:hypothetical protein